MNIYVSNLGFNLESENLKKHFAAYGEVTTVNIIQDKFTNRSRGFAFVEMPDKEAAEKAILELDGSQLEGRSIKVKEARERDAKNGTSAFY